MRIAVIGGRQENEGQLSRMARAAGHELEFADARTRGRGVEAIPGAVARSHLVVIVTDSDGHGAAGVARRAAQRLSRPTLTTQSFGAARLCRLLDALERQRPRENYDLPLVSGTAGGYG